MAHVNMFAHNLYDAPEKQEEKQSVRFKCKKTCWLIAYQSSLGWCCGWAGLAWRSNSAEMPHELAAEELAAGTPKQQFSYKHGLSIAHMLAAVEVSAGTSISTG